VAWPLQHEGSLVVDTARRLSSVVEGNALTSGNQSARRRWRGRPVNRAGTNAGNGSSTARAETEKPAADKSESSVAAVCDRRINFGSDYLWQTVPESISNNATVTDRRYNHWLHRFAWFTAIATLLLICSGGMVTSKMSDSPFQIGPPLSATTCFSSLFKVDRWNFFRARSPVDRFDRWISHYHSDSLAVAFRITQLGA